ncbi:MAG: glycosyltransferase family 4 protein [Proteobacteria bacterium]|nr:glycosyltransferase family 4 protein [Pseudomonadota bacterium]
MRICFYAPFKPLGHPHPSGDLIIATGLYDFLVARGHQVMIASNLRSRWIYWKPWLFPRIIKEFITTASRIRDFSPDLWLTYHSYYKAPDLLGPSLCQRFNLPYCIFQGIYSSKQRRSLRGFPGFFLNRRALLQAVQLFTNRLQDQKNLLRLLPEDRLSYIGPGIFPEQFSYAEEAKALMRRQWQTGNEPVLLSAAMFRPDVKTRGLLWLITALGKLADQGIPFKLVIAGDGSERQAIVTLAQKLLPDRVLFVGRLKRKEMFRFYSGGDLFVFPGIRESLGMVFLEAQSCGLPVVAFDNGGIPEVVVQRETALLTAPFDEDAFIDAVRTLLLNPSIRKEMGNAAATYVRTHHDLHNNYLKLEQILIKHAQTT